MLSGEEVTNEQILNEIRADRRINETKFEAIDQRFESVEQSIRDLKSYMLAGFAILFAGMFALIGFVIWDRRSAIAPVQRESKHLAEEEETTRKILIEYSHIEPKMAKILKQFHLL